MAANTAGGDAAEPRVWIFQANPNKYRILDALETKAEDYWNLNQHAKDVKAGDRVLVWVSGDDAGIYALGTVLTAPVVMPDAAGGMPFWRPPSHGFQAKPRVLVRFDQKFLEHPLRKTFLLTDPILQNLRVIVSPRATNFAVSEDQWQALQEWLNDTGMAE